VKMHWKPRVLLVLSPSVSGPSVRRALSSHLPTSKEAVAVVVVVDEQVNMKKRRTSVQKTSF